MRKRSLFIAITIVLQPTKSYIIENLAEMTNYKQVHSKLKIIANRQSGNGRPSTTNHYN